MTMLVSKDVYVLINYTSFVESVFMALSVVGLFVLRYTQPNLHRPIKVTPPVSHYVGVSLPLIKRLQVFLVHGQVTINFVVSVCLCRVFLSRLRSDLDQTRTHVTCPGLVVSHRI